MNCRNISPLRTSATAGCARVSERGAALVVALLVVALATVMATSIAAEFLLTLRRSGNALLSEQAYAYLRGGEILAGKALREDFEQDREEELFREDDSEFWAQELPPYELDDGWLLGHLEDLQGRLNINALAIRQPEDQREKSIYTVEQEQFIRLLQSFEYPIVGEDDARRITEAVMDWLDEDTLPNNFGAEDDYYFDQLPPSRAANRQFSSISELRAVAYVNQEIYEAVAPHIMVWGGASSSINIHTASDQVLRTLNGRGNLAPLTESELEDILAIKVESGFESLESFKELGVFEGRDMTDLWGTLAENSEYFLFTAEAEVADRRSRLYSVLHRKDLRVDVVGRSYVRPW